MDESVVLIFTNSEDVTADYLCDRLRKSQMDLIRFDTDTSLDSLRVNLTLDGLTLTWGDRSVRPEQIGTVIHRRPKPLVLNVGGDEYQQNHTSEEWAEAIEGFLAHIPADKWINHPTKNYMASHKVQQLTYAHKCGLNVPEWMVTTSPEQANDFLIEHGSEAIVKPLASGYIERDTPDRDTLIYTRSITDTDIALLDRLPNCPVLFQERVNKRADVRLVVVDNQMEAVSLVACDQSGNQRLDIRRDNMCDVEYTSVPVPSSVYEGVSKMMQKYALRFAAIDFAITDDGKWMFFEVNPNGQWAWLDLAGASDIGQMFVDSLQKLSGN